MPTQQPILIGWKPEDITADNVRCFVTDELPRYIKRGVLAITGHDASCSIETTTVEDIQFSWTMQEGQSALYVKGTCGYDDDEIFITDQVGAFKVAGNTFEGHLAAHVMGIDDGIIFRLRDLADRSHSSRSSHSFRILQDF